MPQRTSPTPMDAWHPLAHPSIPRVARAQHLTGQPSMIYVYKLARAMVAHKDSSFRL